MLRLIVLFNSILVSLHLELILGFQRRLFMAEAIIQIKYLKGLENPLRPEYATKVVLRVGKINMRIRAVCDTFGLEKLGNMGGRITMLHSFSITMHSML
jgi:hypothetical protein